MIVLHLSTYSFLIYLYYQMCLWFEDNEKKIYFYPQISAQFWTRSVIIIIIWSIMGKGIHILNIYTLPSKNSIPHVSRRHQRARKLTNLLPSIPNTHTISQELLSQNSLPLISVSIIKDPSWLIVTTLAHSCPDSDSIQ